MDKGHGCKTITAPSRINSVRRKIHIHICKLIFVLCHVVTRKYRNYLNTSAVAGLLFSNTHLNDFEILFKDDFHVVPNS